MNIGILFPRSKAHPRIGIDLMDGLRTFLKQQELTNEFSFVTESIGVGGLEKEVYAKAEKLLLVDDVDMLMGFIDEKVLDIIKPLMMATSKLLIIINPGANLPENWVAQSNIIHLSLRHAFLCALTGSMAGNEKNAGALMASTFYDCGYLHTATMVKHFARAGGKLTYNYINNQAYDKSFEISQLTGFLDANKGTKNLLCIFDSLPASLFYGLLNEYESAGDLKLFVSPMMLEPAALERPENGFKFSIEGYLPWHHTIDSIANKDFTDLYQQSLKKEATVFSLLGWETGMILQQVLVNCSADPRDGSAITEMLKSITLQSPRGELKLDPVSQYLIGPVGKFTINKNSGSIEMEWEINLNREWDDFVEEPIEGVTSGWTNTYLCY